MEKYLVEFPKLNLEFTLTREAFMIGDFAVYWYAVLIAVGTILAVVYGITQSKKYGVNSDKLLDLAIVGIIFGIIGARTYYVIFNFDTYDSFLDMINIRDGGLAIYGGIICGPLAAFIASRINKTRFLPCLDLCAGGFLIGQAIGRWGNFVNQEAFGTNTDSIFGMYSSKTKAYLSDVGWDLFKEGIEVNPAEPVHPCFLYESFLCLVGFLIIVLVYRHIRKFDGEIFLFYTAWYGLGRSIIEGLRTDSLMIGPFRVSQLLGASVCILSVAAIVAIRIYISKKRKEDPKFLMLYADTEESKRQFMDDDATVIEKAEVLINEAEGSLVTAEQKLSKLYFDDNHDDIDTEGENELEKLEDELSSPEEILELSSKLVDLSISKLHLASCLLERFGSDDEEEIALAEEELLEAEDESQEIIESDESDDTSERADEISESIASTREFIAELKEIIETQKLILESKDEAEEEKEPEENVEIIDTVSDEADELDEPNPNANK